MASSPIRQAYRGRNAEVGQGDQICRYHAGERDSSNEVSLGETAMSALGQKQTSAYFRVMSALPPKADIASTFMSTRPNLGRSLHITRQSALPFGFGFSRIMGLKKE
jgi:hypothetical protein